MHIFSQEDAHNTPQYQLLLYFTYCLTNTYTHTHTTAILSAGTADELLSHFSSRCCVTGQVGWHSTGNVNGGGEEREKRTGKNGWRKKRGRQEISRKKKNQAFSIRCLEGLMIMLQLPPASSQLKTTELPRAPTLHSTGQRGGRDREFSNDRLKPIFNTSCTKWYCCQCGNGSDYKGSYISLSVLCGRVFASPIRFNAVATCLRSEC